MTRDAAAIGAGLAAARAARPVGAGERIHVIGIAGAGASAAALHAHHAGALVSGCDAGGPSPYTPALEAAGIAIAWEHDPTHVTADPSPTRLAVTKALTAVAPDHPELVAARMVGLAPEPWQQVIADAAAGRCLIAIAGTHGKSTTSGWLVHVLVAAGLDPSAFVGALLPPASTDGTTPSTARYGAGETFVVEADEYAGNFDPYRPDVAVLTGAEWDHPDVFADGAAVEAAFVAWLRRAPAEASLVVNVGDPGGAAVATRLADRPHPVVAYALVDDASGLADRQRGVAARYATAAGRARPLLGWVVAGGPEGTTLAIHGLGAHDASATAHLRTAGRHNAADALAVAGAAHVLGVPADRIVAGLETFTGVGRRLERKGVAGGVVVYDDYGHHPTAIRETIAAVRQLEPGRRVWAVYEPLTYHRTAALLDAFAASLATADAVLVADIWAGRDPDTTITSAMALASAVAGLRPGSVVDAPGSVEATADRLVEQAVDGDVILVMGGGHSYRIGERFLAERVARRAEEGAR